MTLQRDNRWFDVVGSLRPGARIDEARVQLRDLAKRLALGVSRHQSGRQLYRPSRF